jgi:diguanylate cyclase (GGDEF)-like protein
MVTSNKASARFLSFSLIAQTFLAITFALYSYSRGEIKFVIFYMSVAIILSLALGISHINRRQDIPRGLLAITLLAGSFYLLINTSNDTSILWCLTTVPTLVSTFGNRQSLFMLAGVFAASILLLISGTVPFITYQYESVIIMRLLSSLAILAIFSVALDRSLITSVDNCKTLSNKRQDLAQRDALTNLANRHNMEEQLKLKTHNNRLNQANFSIVLADIDNFRLLNERYGRSAGDMILKETAHLLSRQLRDDDILARWGGKQFIILLPEASAQEAEKIAERLRLKFADLDIQVEGDQLAISASMGVASIEKCIDLDDLISRVENSIYQAKHMGRNRVVVS